MTTPTIKALVERLNETAHAISQYAPEQWGSGELMAEAATALTTLSQENEDLRAGLREIEASARGSGTLSRDDDARTLQAIERHAARALLKEGPNRG